MFRIVTSANERDASLASAPPPAASRDDGGGGTTPALVVGVLRRNADVTLLPAKGPFADERRAGDDPFANADANTNTSGNGDGDATSNKAPKQTAREAIRMLETGLASLKARNPTVRVESSGDAGVSMTLGSPRGVEVRVRADRDGDDVVVLNTPYGGPKRYVFDADARRWVSESGDKHDMLGLLLRDLLPHIVGLPDFLRR